MRDFSEKIHDTRACALITVHPSLVLLLCSHFIPLPRLLLGSLGGGFHALPVSPYYRLSPNFLHTFYCRIATFLINAPNVNRLDPRFQTYWTINVGDAFCNQGVNVENTEQILEVYRWNGNQCSSPFSITQMIHLPVGKYKLEMQGFYRDGEYDEAAQKRNSGTEQIDVFLFAGNEKVPLHSIFDDIPNSRVNGAWSTWTSLGYVPNTMAEAGNTFKAGAYNNSLEFKVNEESDMEIGVYGLESFNYNNWTTIDNFRLTYYGDTGTGIERSMTNGQATSAIYNLSGQRLTAPRKGINIINGKKVLVK